MNEGANAELSEAAGEAPQHNIGMPQGELRGTAVIRDKEGNIKGTFEFGGPASAEEAQKVSDAVGIPLTPAE